MQAYTLTHSDKRSLTTVRTTNDGRTYDENGLELNRWNGDPANLEHLQAFPELAAYHYCKDQWVGYDGLGKWGFFSHGPRHIQFMLGDNCNAKCIHCPQNARRRQRGGKRWPNLPAEAIIQNIQHHKETLKSMELVSFGEPLMHPQIGEIIDAIADAGILFSMVTNGSLIEPHIDKIISVPGWLTFSIDSPIPAHYKTIRQGLDLETVGRNLALAAGHPGKLVGGRTQGHGGRRVGVNMGIWSETIDEVVQMISRLSKLNVDYLSLFPVQNLDTAGARGKIPDEREWLALAELIERMQKVYPELTINNYTGYPKKTGEQQAAADAPPYCIVMWQGYEIGPDGVAHPGCCSYDIDLGNWDDDVWKGEPMQALRKQMLAGEIDPNRFGSCSKCGHRRIVT